MLDYCQQHQIDFQQLLQDKATTLHHFIGKDILYFHALFWPAILKSQQLLLPSKLCVHGFLNINGNKMSKSRNTLIGADELADIIDAELIRYYLAAKATANITDMNFIFSELIQKINSDLIGKFINIASRAFKLNSQYFANELLATHDSPIIAQLLEQWPVIKQDYDNQEFARVIKNIMKSAELLNQYINDKEPWKLVKDNAQLGSTHYILSELIIGFALIASWLQPIMPKLTIKIANLFKLENLTLQDKKIILDLTKHQQYEMLLTRIDSSLFANFTDTEVTIS